MPKPASEHDIVMVLVVVGHLQKRSDLQAEKADHFELRKTTAGLLTNILRPLELVRMLIQAIVFISLKVARYVPRKLFQ
jgi:hypothetical protein